MSHVLKFVPVITILVSAYACDVMETRHLQAPLLEPENVLRQIVCHRPGRLIGEPCIQARPGSRDDQTIIDNYGHGSFGFGGAWESARRAVELLPDGEEPPVVVGAGIIALTTAYLLVKAGRAPRAIIADRFDDLTSHNAGGMLAYESSHADLAVRNRVNSLFTKSHKVWAEIADGKHWNFMNARFLPAYFPSREASDLEASVAAGLVCPGKDVVVSFGTAHDTPRRMVAYDNAIFVDTLGMMHALRAYMESREVPFLEQHIASLHDVGDSVVFNCTGLGARELANDGSMHPVQGHLLALKGQIPGSLDYMIEEVVSRGTTTDGKPISRMVYGFPKKFRGEAPGTTAVLGGTSIAHADGSTPHHEEFELLRQRARKYFGIDPKKQ